MPDNKKIELHSESVQEILGTPPRWIVRYGIMIIFVIILLLIIGSKYIKYPEILKTTMSICRNDSLKGNPFECRILLLSKDVNSIGKDQRIIVKLDDYPHTDYGVVELKIDDSHVIIEDDTNEGSKMIVVKLPDCLFTHQNKYIPYHQNMTGTADIIIDEISLFDRIITMR